MLTRKRPAPPVLRCYALALLAAGCGPPGDQGLSARIAERVEAGPGTVIDLAELSPFEWTQLYVFEPYTREEYAEQRMGRSWPPWWRWGNVDMLDDRSFLVFINGDEIVSAFNHSIESGDFSPYPEHLVERPDGFSPIEARFVVERRDDSEWYRALVPVSAHSPDEERGRGGVATR